MNYLVTAIDEHGDTYRETVAAQNEAAAKETASAIFSRDMSNRYYRIVSVSAPFSERAGKYRPAGSQFDVE